MEDLRKFLVWCGKEGYAASPTELTQEDGSHTIVLHKDNFKFHDNFFGGEPFGGREVVFDGAKAIWMMVYYGAVENPNDTKNLYSFLKEALARVPEEAPYRGPKFVESGAWRYENMWHGELARFHGEEAIYSKGEKVFTCRYAGGAVDK